jgi:hypothetical protein
MEENTNSRGHVMARRKLDDETLLTYVRADIEAADLYFEDEIEPACIKRLQRFMSDPTYYETLFPALSKRCSLTMSDVADTVYWIIPALMKIFFGSTDVVTISGRTAEDNAEAMQELCNWQIQRKNKGFMRFYKWFMDALTLGHGVIKIRWDRRTKEVEEIATMTPEEFLQFDQDQEEVKFISAKEQPDGSYKVKVRREKMIADHAVIENVPVSEYRWLPDSSEVEGLQFCYHRRLMSRSEIESLVNAGVFEPVTDEELSSSIYNSEQDGELEGFYKENDNQMRDGAAGLDKSRTMHWVNECFGKYDIDGDNVSEDMIITVIGEKIVRREVNELERAHFAVLSPYPDQYQITGNTIDDMIGELQDIKVAMYRQIILNVANNNDRQAIIDEDSLNAEDLRENRKYIRAGKLMGRPVAATVQFMPEAPLASAAFPMLQQIDQIKENRTGVTKYNQGGDSKDLNKTATGITAIMASANQRIEMIARMFSETGVIDLFRLLVEMNTRYVSTETVIRLTNGKDLNVRPDDLKGEFDLDVAAGVGAGQRQEATQNMMLLISQIYPALVQMGVPQPLIMEKVLTATKTLVEQMGYKDSAKYVPAEEDIIAFMQQQQEAMMMQQQQQVQAEQQAKGDDLQAKVLLEMAKGGKK